MAERETYAVPCRSSMKFKFGSGLLGAGIEVYDGASFDPKDLEQERLAEIERRILAIEAALARIEFPLG